MQHSISHTPAVERHLLPARGGLRRLAPGEFVDWAVAQHDTLVVADGRRLVAALLRACARTTVVRSINAVHATTDTPRHHNVLRHVCEQREGWGGVCRRRGGSGGIGCAQRMARLSQERDACSYIKESAVALTSAWALPPRASCLLLAAAITDQHTQQQQQQQQQQAERWQRPPEGRGAQVGPTVAAGCRATSPPSPSRGCHGWYCFSVLLSCS